MDQHTEYILVQGLGSDLIRTLNKLSKEGWIIQSSLTSILVADGCIWHSQLMSRYTPKTE